MRPYNIEIFDRYYNFLYSALLDESDFVYREDVMDPIKNSIKVPVDFIPRELAPNDPTAPRGWFIRILRDGEEYQGYISAFEIGQEQHKITYSQLITMLDITCYISPTELDASTIEEYIKTLIEAEFIDNADSLHITGLSAETIITQSASTGVFEYQDTDKTWVKINLLDDLIYPAFETYGIVTTVTFDPQAQTVNIAIGKNDAATKTIEADLPNILNSEFTIQKNSNEVNRIDIYDTSTDPPTLHNFYLHADGTWDSTDADRIYPVVNNVQTVDGSTAAKKIVDQKYDALLATMSAYAAYDGTLTSDMITELTAAVNILLPVYIANCGFPKNAVTLSNGRLVSYNQSNIEPEPESGAIVEVASATFDIAPAILNTITASAGLYFTTTSTGWDESQSVYVRTFAGTEPTNDHVRITATVRMMNYDHGNIYFNPNTGIYMYTKYPYADASFTVHFTYEMAKAGVNAYKDTQAYEDEIAEAQGTAAYEVMTEKAESIFNRNRYSNLIELEMQREDSMITPLALDMGQIADVIHGGVSYNTMLSGRQIKDGTATLTFGTIRLELTSYLKGRY